MSLDNTPPLQLSPEQQAIFQRIAQSSENFFVTGKAGTGKSFLLQYLRHQLPKNLVVVAPTGVAALVVGGQTIHSLFQLPPAFIRTEAIRLSKPTKELLSQLEVLIIDEVSMVRADLMDAMDVSLRQAKRNRLPFGGVQVVMFGDLYQLPPIVRDDELRQHFAGEYDGPFFFQAHVWERLPFVKVELTDVFRQKEQELIEVLNAIRTGTVTQDHLDVLNRRVGMFEEDERALTLTTTNRRSAQINSYFLNQLAAQSFVYRASVKGQLDPKMFPADSELLLKAGAQVMFLKNDKDKRWVNGTIGKVVRTTATAVTVLVDGLEHEVARENWSRIRYKLNHSTGHLDEEVVSMFSQVPLRLAWAVTIHKSQGQTFDRVTIDLERGAFAHGQTYVALSRCRTLAGMSLSRAVEERDVIVDPKIVAFMSDEQKGQNRLF